MNKSQPNLITKFIFIFFSFFFILNSCKKTEDKNGEKIDDLQQQKILTYISGPRQTTIGFDQFRIDINVKQLGRLATLLLAPNPSKGKLMTINTSDTYKGFTLQTDSIKVIKADGHTIYIFSVKQSSPRAITFQNLTIDESINGTLIFVNTYVPTQKWINEWRKGHSGMFEGEISITYLDQPIQTLSNPISIRAHGKISFGKVPNKIGLEDVNGCDWMIYYYDIPYMCGSGLHWPGDINCSLTGDSGAGYAIGSYEVTRCGGGTGGGTAPTPGNDYDPCGSGTTPPPTNNFNGVGGQKIMSGARGDHLMVHENPECNPTPPVDIIHELDDYLVLKPWCF